MTENDQKFALDDIPAAIALLSRLPVAVNPEWAEARGAFCAWAYPLAGVAIGVVAGLVGSIALWLGVPPELAAALTLVALIMVTGALHEDGLADSADGLWGGQDPAARLEIMKDSRIGTYGVLALATMTLIRWLGLTALFADGHSFWAVIGGAALSRVPMVALMDHLPNAREDGLSAAQGAPGLEALWGAIGVGVIVGLICLGWVIIPVGVVLLILILAVASLARKKIGGQTGDILGAMQQLSEAAILIVLAARLA